MSVVTLYLWGACLQAWPSVQPLSLTKIDNNNNNNNNNIHVLRNLEKALAMALKQLI